MADTNKSKVLYGVIAILSIMVLGLGGTLVYTYITDSDNMTNESRNTAESNNSSDTLDNEGTHGGVNVANHPSYSLKLGDEGELSVPQGWYVSKIISKTDPLSEEVKETHNLTGVWPIHYGTEVVLSNDRSQVNIVRRPLVALGPIGFTCVPIDLEGWEIVKESTSENDYGVARKEQDGVWTYETFYLMEECMGQDTEYGLLDVSHQEGFTFTGNEGDLETADELFIEAFIQDKFKLYGELTSTVDEFSTVNP
jgi:hypothetical protein